MIQPLRVLLSVSLVATLSLFLGSCKINDAGSMREEDSTQKFTNWAPLMNEVVYPFTEMVVDELTKDPEDTDFGRLQQTAEQIAGYLKTAGDKNSPLFMPDPEEAGHAVTAKAWFDSLAAAAKAKDSRKLEQLFSTGKKKTCTLCHD